MKERRHECIHKMFEKQVEKTPNNRAVVYGETLYSYHELNSKANQLAHRLIKLGIKPGDFVAVCCERSPLLIIVLLAVQKAGGAYVPLDPEYPDDRLIYMLEDCEPKVFIYEDGLGKNFEAQKNSTEIECIEITEYNNIFVNENTENPKTTVTHNDYLYVIYTSGSTGRPKGTLVFHRGFHNLITWYCRELEFGYDSRPLLMTSFSFDLTQKNIYAPLITGGCLYLPW